MPAYRITLAYDGGPFHGWQRQGAGGGATVQLVLEEALSRLSRGAPVTVAGAGRTDAGVHALGQVASFELPADLEPGALAGALNGILPGEVRVLEAARAPEGFHARRSALGKHYRYVLDTGPLRLPTRRRLAGHVRFRLDQPRVREAALLYLGRQDFASLASSGGGVKTTVRTVRRSDVSFDDVGAGSPSLTYDVEADGFLRKMVRSMVGGLVAAGRGASSIDGLRRALEARDRRAWPAPVEPCGLTLVSVRYPC